jgi:hypothetical protein
MGNGQNLWSSEETSRARKLLARNATAEEFRIELGRSKAAAQARILYLDNPRSRERTKERAYRQKMGERADPMPTGIQAERPRSIPPHLVVEARQRSAAARSITAFVFGDPPPGYSALDKRTAEALA